MPSELIKRILTSMAIFPLSIFFVFQGGYLLLSFLLAIFFIASYELFSVFKKISNILFLDLVLILALFSIYYLAENSLLLLLWVIILVICSDIGGYVFGKIFKWKKLTKISPKKTVSGVLGSFIFSLLSVFIIQLIIEILYPSAYSLKDNFLIPEFFFLAIVFSLVAQAGDLTISYFKRLEKIKDIGKILPGHGGIFDRIDGLMFVVILTLVLYKFNVIT